MTNKAGFPLVGGDSSRKFGQSPPSKCQVPPPPSLNFKNNNGKQCLLFSRTMSLLLESPPSGRTQLGNPVK